MLISSLQNSGVKEAVKLRERRHRDRTGRFLIEGYRELLRAADGGFAIEHLYVCPELFLGSNEQALIDRFDCEVHQTSEEVFRKLSYRDRPDGLLAVALQKRSALANLSKTGLYVVAEAIEKPGNLGTILRSCDGTGVAGVIVCDRCTDIFNPNVVRASVGTLFTQPVVEATSDETLAWLKQNKISLVAATPDAEPLYTDVDLSGNVAIAVGTEQLGLSDKLMEAADIQVRLPMLGTADSLNVSIATAVLLYESVRQRYNTP